MLSADLNLDRREMLIPTGFCQDFGDEKAKVPLEGEGERADIEELYRDLLYECYQPVKFGELEYSPSQILEAVDPVAFRIGVGEYADSEIEDGRIIELNGKYYCLDGVTE